MGPLDAVERWPGTHAAAVVARVGSATTIVGHIGPMDQSFAHASVTKIATSIAVLTAVGSGSCRLDDAVGPPGATLAHLLSHASGLPLDGDVPVAPPGQRRIYSNVGIELAAQHAATACGTTPQQLVAERVLAPLGMARTSLARSVASDAVGPTLELCALAGELLVPRLVPGWLADALGSVAFPGLAGVLPGFGRQVPCDWGLGVEVKGTKSPHWTGPAWPAWTVGHFGQLGGFIAADPQAGVAVVTLGDEPFGPWAVEAWPGFTDSARPLA